MTHREGSTEAPRRGESNSLTRFDTPALRRAMSRCIHAGNPKWSAVQLGLDYTTVCAWGQRHPNAPPGADRPRLNGPAKQLAILMDCALEFTSEEQERDDAMAPLHWLCGEFGMRAVDETVAETRGTAQACALVLKGAGALVGDVLEMSLDGLDDAEREQLDSQCRALEARVREVRSLVAGPARLRAVGGAR